MEADGIPPLLSTIDTIVLVGAFNPLILDPYWLVQHEIIDEFDLEHARDTKKWLVTRDITIVEFRRFSLQADPNRVQVAMTQETETPLLIADVVVNIFRQLSHTPVRALGLNHARHEELNEGRSEEILNRLAPRDVVEDLVPGIGVASLSWRAERPDDYAGQVFFHRRALASGERVVPELERPLRPRGRGNWRDGVEARGRRVSGVVATVG